MAVRLRRRRRIALAIGLLVAIALIVTGVVLSPLMTLTTIVVSGRDTVPEKVITGATDDQLGKPLALIDTDAIRSRLASVTRIESFTTELQPPHTLVIRIVERRAIGYMNHGTKWDIVDAAGVVLDTSSTPPSTLPLLSVASTTDLAFSAVSDVLAALPESFRNSIAGVTARTRDSITIVMKGTPHRLLWGSPDETPLKVLVAKRALAIVAKRGGAYEIDVSAPDNIVLRPI
jgi:cell division protein FtsQ